MIVPEWDNPEKTAVYIRFEGSWTWDNFNESHALVESMLDEVNHPVSLIIHIVDNTAARPPANAFDHWDKAMDAQNADKVPQVIMVSDSFIVRFFVTMGQRVLRRNKSRKLSVVSHLDDARALVAAQSGVPVP
jgi:hypothetical protein